MPNSNCMIWQTSVIPIESPIQNMLFLLSSLWSSNQKESAYLKIEKSNEMFCYPITHVKWKLYIYQRICIPKAFLSRYFHSPWNIQHAPIARISPVIWYDIISTSILIGIVFKTAFPFFYLKMFYVFPFIIE